MATIQLESFKVFNASLKEVEKRKGFWKEMRDEYGDSLLSITEEETKFKLLTLLNMASYTSTTISIDSYEFALIEESL